MFKIPKITRALLCQLMTIFVFTLFLFGNFSFRLSTKNIDEFHSQDELQRFGHSATVLQDGRVFIVGQWGWPIVSQVLYDPVSHELTPAAAMHVKRAFHSATLLRSGQVLVAGGCDTDKCTRSAELYDPKDNSWRQAYSMKEYRSRHTAVLLDNGNVLMIGGHTRSASVTGIEQYQTDSQSFKTVFRLDDDLPEDIYYSATPLPAQQKILITKKRSTFHMRDHEMLETTVSFAIGLIEYDLSCYQTLSSEVDAVHEAVGLETGKILFLFGSHEHEPKLFNPSTDTFEPISRVAATTFIGGLGISHAALLNGRDVLVCGGLVPKYVESQSCYLFDANQSAFKPTGFPAKHRRYHTTSLLATGKVLFWGGLNDADGMIQSVDVYDMETGKFQNYLYDNENGKLQNLHDDHVVAPPTSPAWLFTTDRSDNKHARRCEQALKEVPFGKPVRFECQVVDFLNITALETCQIPDKFKIPSLAEDKRPMVVWVSHILNVGEMRVIGFSLIGSGHWGLTLTLHKYETHETYNIWRIDEKEIWIWQKWSGVSEEDVVYTWSNAKYNDAPYGRYGNDAVYGYEEFKQASSPSYLVWGTVSIFFFLAILLYRKQ